MSTTVRLSAAAGLAIAAALGTRRNLNRRLEALAALEADRFIAGWAQMEAMNFEFAA